MGHHQTLVAKPNLSLSRFAGACRLARACWQPESIEAGFGTHKTSLRPRSKKQFVTEFKEDNNQKTRFHTRVSYPWPSKLAQQNFRPIHSYCFMKLIGRNMKTLHFLSATLPGWVFWRSTNRVGYWQYSDMFPVDWHTSLLARTIETQLLTSADLS